MYVLMIAYAKNGELDFRIHDEYAFASLREAQLAIENQWELDLENSDVWVEELSPEQREDLFPKQISEMFFRCEKIPGYDFVEYQIVEEV